MSAALPPRFVGAALVLSAAASAGLLAGAHLFERLAGLAPCALCLDQREAHWAALTLAVAGLALGALFRCARITAAAAGALALVYLVSSALAAYHAGVEFHFWPGPASCSGGGPVTGDIDLAGALDEGPAAPSCSEAAWRFLGISMAGYNLLASAGLFAVSLIAAAQAAREMRRNAPLAIEKDTAA